jgi:hypothetical protein
MKTIIMQDMGTCGEEPKETIFGALSCLIVDF